MDDVNRITLVIVDTCAYRDANSDFLGVTRQLLPSFFAAIEEKGIVLLTHPVLDNEIHKHIDDSGLFKNYQSLVTLLDKCSGLLQRFECDNQNLFDKIRGIDIKERLFEAYKSYYDKAIHLDFGNPATVFGLYFAGLPPFAASGKKKSEFPDAFVFDATKNFLENHSNDVLLVVSKDPDWISAFDKLENVYICESISDALTQISRIDSILSQEMLEQIFKGAYEEFASKAQRLIECECFELENYENFNELEIKALEVEKIDGNFTPLKITRDSVLLSAEVVVKLSGYAEVWDEDNSVWDSVDREYVYMAYADIDFEDAEATVECEVGISFDFDNPEGTAQVTHLKLLNQDNICINCENAVVTEINEDEMALRTLREDKGYPRRSP